MLVYAIRAKKARRDEQRSPTHACADSQRNRGAFSVVQDVSNAFLNR